MPSESSAPHSRSAALSHWALFGDSRAAHAAHPVANPPAVTVWHVHVSPPTSGSGTLASSFSLARPGSPRTRCRATCGTTSAASCPADRSWRRADSRARAARGPISSGRRTQQDDIARRSTGPSANTRNQGCPTVMSAVSTAPRIDGSGERATRTLGRFARGFASRTAVFRRVARPPRTDASATATLRRIGSCSVVPGSPAKPTVKMRKKGLLQLRTRPGAGATTSALRRSSFSCRSFDVRLCAAKPIARESPIGGSAVESAAQPHTHAPARTSQAARRVHAQVHAVSTTSVHRLKHRRTTPGAGTLVAGLAR